jgi:hypothetical protein
MQYVMSPYGPIIYRNCLSVIEFMVPSAASTVSFVTSQARPPCPTWPGPWGPATGGSPMPWGPPGGGFWLPQQWTPCSQLGLNLDAINAREISGWRVVGAMGTFGWRVANTVGTSSWRATNVVGAALVTSAFTNLGMSTNFS